TTRPPLVPGEPTPIRTVPESIPRPEYVWKDRVDEANGEAWVQPPEVVEAMREASRVAADALAAAGAAVAPGVTTAEVDRVAHEYMCDHGAYPSTLGYKAFPKSSCVSLNEVICHGIPDTTVIRDGDIVKIDVTAYLGRVQGDTKYPLLAGAGRCDYTVVREFTGHGVGPTFHNGLVVLHYDEPARTEVLEPGMTLTVEPMISLGGAGFDVWDDDWTVTTADKAWTAQFEHTVL